MIRALAVLALAIFSVNAWAWWTSSTRCWSSARNIRWCATSPSTPTCSASPSGCGRFARRSNTAPDRAPRGAGEAQCDVPAGLFGWGCATACDVAAGLLGCGGAPVCDAAAGLLGCGGVPVCDAPGLFCGGVPVCDVHAGLLGSGCTPA